MVRHKKAMAEKKTNRKNETTFEFLERNGLPGAATRFQFIQKWLNEYPECDRKELEGRLKSSAEFQFALGAIFELHIFALLKKCNCEVEVHPTFTCCTGKVDFCATYGDEKFYLEATTILKGQGQLRSSEVEYDAIRKIREEIIRPHSDVKLKFRGSYQKFLSKKCLVTMVRETLKSHTPEEVRMHFERCRNQIPQANFTKDGLKMEVFLTPPWHPSGVGEVLLPEGSVAGDGSLSLHSALKKKAKKWRKKKVENEMFLIAINACHGKYSRGEEVEAIYGQSIADGGQQEFRDELRGASGIIVFDNLTLGNEEIASLKLFRNGNHRIPECLEFLEDKDSADGWTEINFLEI